MAIATLSIDIVAQLAKLQAGMDQATKVVSSAADKMNASFARVGAAAGALGGAAAVGFLAAQTRAAIDLADRMDDLAEKYGIAAGTLSQYRYASEVAGTPTEALATGLQKLSKAASEGSKGLALIGVSTKDATGALKSSDQLLLDVADKFAGYRDGAGKAALAQEIFGKSGADLIPLLNRGSAGIRELRGEAVALGAAFGDDTAKAAADFSDNLTRLRLVAEGASVALVKGMLPSLIQITEQLIEGRRAFGGYIDAARIVGLQTNPFKDEGGNIRKVAADLESARAELLRFQSLPAWQRPMADNLGWQDTEGRIKAQIAESTALLGYLKKLQQNAALRESGGVLDARDARAQVAAPKRDAPGIADANAAAKAAEEAKKVYDGLIDTIRKKRAETEAELATGQKLNEQQRFELDIRTKLDAEKGKLTPQLRAQVEAEAALASASLTSLRVQQELNRGREYSRTLLEKTVAQYDREAESLAAGNAALAQQVEAYGLTQAALERLTLARMDEVIAKERELLVSAQNVEGNEAEVRGIEARIRGLQRQRDLTNQLQGKERAERQDGTIGASKAIDEFLDRTKQAGEIARTTVAGAISTLENNLVDSLAAGKLDVRGFVDYMIKEFLRLQVVKPLLDDLLNFAGGSSKGGGLLSAITAIFGFAKGGAFAGGAQVPITAFAAGGVLTKPAIFPMKASLGLMAEAGPEAIMPLKRGPGGRLGVSLHGGSAGGVVNNVYNVQAGVTRNELVTALQIMQQQTDAKLERRLRTVGAA